MIDERFLKMSFIESNKQLDVLSTNVDEILPEDQLYEKIKKSKKNTILL